MKRYIDACKEHWKEILVLSFSFHFLVDWFIFGLGVLIGSRL